MALANRILLVDDDRAILSSFRDLLTPHGYEVDTSETGRDAVNKSIGKVYDLVIIDIKLPDMEGTELLARLHWSHPRPKKIMITGYPTLENAIGSVNLHADAYLVKPVTPAEFLRVVEEKIREKTEEAEIDDERVAHWLEARPLKSKGRSAGRRTDGKDTPART